MIFFFLHLLQLSSFFAFPFFPSFSYLKHVLRKTNRINNSFLEVCQDLIRIIIILIIIPLEVEKTQGFLILTHIFCSLLGKKRDLLQFPVTTMKLSCPSYLVFSKILVSFKISSISLKQLNATFSKKNVWWLIYFYLARSNRMLG